MQARKQCRVDIAQRESDIIRNEGEQRHETKSKEGEKRNRRNTTKRKSGGKPGKESRRIKNRVKLKGCPGGTIPTTCVRPEETHHDHDGHTQAFIEMT